MIYDGRFLQPAGRSVDHRSRPHRISSRCNEYKERPCECEDQQKNVGGLEMHIDCILSDIRPEQVADLTVVELPILSVVRTGICFGLIELVRG